jgi:23S rRNA pseudouridine2605 synthase
MRASEGPGEERLQKFLARAGVASRRHAEALILAGRVRVNGEVVRLMGSRVRPALDRVQVDGELVRPERLVTLLLHKPAGYITSLSDPQGRPVVTSLLPAGEFPRLYPVGRLDWDTEGLLLLTNDGALAHALSHPRFHVRRLYHAKVRGRPTPEALERLARGVASGGERLRALAVEILRTTEHNAWLAITLGEGRYRQVRRMCEAVGYPVVRLIRVGLGPLALRDLPRGAWRPLTAAELSSLHALVPKAGGSAPGHSPSGPAGGNPPGRRPRGGPPRGNTRERAPGGRPRERAPSGNPRERA